MVLILVTLGRYLETRGKVQASDAVMALEALIPDEVDVTRNGHRSRKRSSELIVGDLVHVPPGQTIPVDGIVVDGNGYLDQQIVTGESALALKSVGDEMHAGTTSPDQAFTVRATAVGHQSTVGRMADLLEEARQTGGRYERLADRVTAFFVPVVVMLALTAAWLGAQANGLEEAIPRALAVLLISCPCALGIATPMATWVALGRAATRGVLFRSGAAIEILARVRGVSIDKTGTLTTRTPQVRAFNTGAVDGPPRRKLIAMAAGLSQTSRHVLAEGITRYAQRENVAPVEVKDAKAVPGLGMEGHADGDVIRVGSLAMLESASVRFAGDLRERATVAMESGHSIACVARNDNVVGVFTFSEQLRPEAKDTITRLRELGCAIQVLTGDHRARGAALSTELEVSAIAELSPTQKIEEIRKQQGRARSVAMVGDGLNDAPALVAADIGIAMGCGADISRDSADLCLLGDDLTGVPWSIKLARRTVRTIKTNLFWAFAYNACCVPLAMAGILNPVVAAIAMVVSSLFVVTNSARLSMVPLYD